MRYGPLSVKDKTGRDVVLRNAEESDAPALLQYLKVTAGETPFLVREADEIDMTVAQQEAFLKSKIDDERELMLIATVDGKHVGNCALMSISGLRRCRHRCGVAIALYQEYCGSGIGRLMLETIFEVARKAGYEQAELEVIADNTNAYGLYKKLGFVEYGRMPDNMRYDDGTFADSIWMMKKL